MGNSYTNVSDMIENEYSVNKNKSIPKQLISAIAKIVQVIF